MNLSLFTKDVRLIDQELLESSNDKINQKHTPIMKKKQDEAIEVLRKFELKTEITRITGKKTT
jgi:hypothetical protein